MILRAAVIALVAAWWAAAGATTAPKLVRVAVRAQGDAPDAKAFRAVVGEVESKIVRVLTPADPQMLLLVLDLVGDLGTIEPARQALIQQVEALPASTYVGVLRAQDGVSVLVDPTGDRAPVIAAIRDLTISGRPGLLEAMDPVEKLADAIGQKAQVRVAVLHITDSDVREYREDFTNPVINSSDPHDLSRRFPETLIQEKMSKFETQFAKFQTPLHMVHLTYRGDRLNEAYRNGLQRLAEGLAGSAVFCRSHMEVGDAIQQAFAAIGAEYTVIVPLPERTAETVQVRISAGDAVLIYRTRFKTKER